MQDTILIFEQANDVEKESMEEESGMENSYN